MLYNEIKHFRIIVTGKVQGVGFRYSAKISALKLNITGYVRNLPDGSVYIEAEGTESMLSEFISWCNTGPARAIVRKVEVQEGPAVCFEEFQIR